MTDRDLAGCPCCGSADVFAESYIIEAMVKCRGCGLRVTRPHGPRDERGLPEAIAAWNRRTPSSEGDGRDGERYRWLRENDNADLLAEDVIDQAIAAAAGGGDT